MNDSIAHHGIQGQKWGVRQYQNPDGTLTEAGRKHLAKLDKNWVKKNETTLKNKALDAALNDRATQYKIAGINAKYPGNTKYKTNRQFKTSYTNAVNRVLAESMSQQVSGIRSPSGKVVSFVAATGSHKLGEVYTAMSNEGYDLSKLSKGINAEGKMSYKRKKKENYLEMI